ncbi:MAG: sugar phosphate isomerase/epimerase family protein [Thermodesulfobacteriota bacterium]|nr:MAG: sugar phosphate isomerase/epimerase family protein [Thermodesulfobacteriota bacterium]
MLEVMGDRKRVQVHVPYPYLLEKTGRLMDLGINPEIFMDAFFIEEARPRDLERIRDAFAEKGLTITVHGPYIDLNPGSREEKTRLLTVGVYDRLFGVVEILKPRTVVLHAGYHERKYKGDKDLWLSQSLKTWPEFVKRAERIGTVIAVENIFEREPSTLRLLMDELPSPNLGICLDAGHMRVFSEVDFEEWFAALGPRVAEVHLHDNHGKRDDHLPIGDGSIDFERFMDLLSKYTKDPVYTIEPHGEDAMFRAIEAVRRYL